MVTINYKDGRPFYEQVKEDLRRLVVSGVLRPGDKLPSVRELAGQLAINPNTIQRAYRELEHEGFIYSVTGRGSFVAALSQVDDSRKAARLAEFRAAAQELMNLGMSRGALTAMLEELEQEGSHD